MSSHLLDSTCGHERLPLLVLLRAGLWEREPDDISCFRSPSFSWESLFRLARQQTVTGLVFNGLQYLPDSLLPPEPMLIRWAAESDAIERRNIHMNKCLDELYSFFRKRGLNPILQKGQGTARFYERPLLRECGDIDFYFNNVRAWDFAHTYIRRLKINVRRQPDRSLFYSWRGVTVEHHKRLFDVYNPFLQDFLNRLEHENGCQGVRLSPDFDVDVTVPSPFSELLLLNLHILKHSLGRGIGLRQLCDMARACYKLHDVIDSDKMKSVSVRLGLHRWNPLLHAFLVECLGLPVGCLPYSDVAPAARPLSDIVWRGGNFGQHYGGQDVVGVAGIRRKLATARSFGRNVRFSLYYAPKDAFWLMGNLLKGQILC